MSKGIGRIRQQKAHFTFPNWSKYCLTSSMVVLTDRPPTKIFFVLVTSLQHKKEKGSSSLIIWFGGKKSVIKRLFVIYLLQKASEICRFQPSAQVNCEDAYICMSPCVFRGQRSGAEYKVIVSCQTSVLQLLFGLNPDSNPGQPGLRD